MDPLIDNALREFDEKQKKKKEQFEIERKEAENQKRAIDD